ncbi:MAG: anaerobic ribonucleoside-triphosphate reductase [Gemmatimonadales bacterium]|nr:anaerobic ribonucleoside-triphosphate reductase [Gemmatimonadales bacterium]
MTVAELPDRWEAEPAPDGHEHGPGWLVRDTRFETLHHMTTEAFAALTVPQLAAVTPRGRDVDHITRVTGYFSYTSRFNNGKRAELDDRFRTRVEGASII